MPVYNRGNGFQANFLLKGWPRVREQFNTVADAEAYELACRAAHKLGKPRPEVPQGGSKGSHVSDIQDLVDYCHRVRWARKKSGAGLTHNAQQFADWVGPAVPSAEALTAVKIDEYLGWRQTAKSNSGSTLNRHLSAISVLGEQALRLKLIPAKIELSWQEEGVGRLRFYTPEEETMLLGAVVGWSQPDYHDLFAFLLDTGARLGETQKLPWQDIRGKLVTFHGEFTKNGESRTVTLTPRAQAAIGRLRAKYGTLKGPFYWLDRQALRVLWNRLRAHFAWMGDDTVVHTFRHTCASRLVQRGVDLYRVKTWMGHKNIETTMRYAHLAPKQLEELADVLATFNQHAAQAAE